MKVYNSKDLVNGKLTMDNFSQWKIDNCGGN